MFSVAYLVYIHTVMTHYVYLAGYIKNEFSMLPETSSWFFPLAPLIHLLVTPINNKLLVSALLYRHVASETRQEKQSFLTQRVRAFSSCTYSFSIISRNNKTRKFLSLPCMYIYTFSFTLKLTTILLHC